MNPVKSFFLLFFLLLFGISHAQTFTAVKDAASVQKQITEASKAISTIQCDFTQEKSMSMLAEKAQSKGKFYFMRENKVRLEYQHPVKNLVVMNNGKMLISDEKKTTQTDTHRSKVFQQLNNIIIGSINGSLFNGSDFAPSFYENGTQLKVELKPVSKMLKNFLSTVVIVLEKKDFTASRIEMHEPSGDNTILHFSAKQINGKVAEELFTVK
ncbi:MAG: outer membrane lipoprotein carrier protein LolA [Chitinophagales bacterium]|nr:outer membrane lipoprotein carrier protein LolA [Chitinophagales bacterium]